MPVKLLMFDHNGVLDGVVGNKSELRYEPAHDLDLTTEEQEWGGRRVLAHGQEILRKINRLVKEFGYTAVSFSANAPEDQSKLFGLLRSACNTHHITYPEMLNSWNDRFGEDFVQNAGKEAILDRYETYYGDELDKAHSIVFDDGPPNVQLARNRGYQGFCIDEKLSLNDALDQVIAAEEAKARAVAEQEKSAEEIVVGSSSSHPSEGNSDVDLELDDIYGSDDDKGKEQEDVPAAPQSGYFTEDADPNRLHPLFLTYDEVANKPHLVFSDHLPILLPVPLSNDSTDTLKLISWNTLGKNAPSGLHQGGGWESDNQAQQRYNCIAEALIKMIEEQGADCILLQETEIALLQNAEVGIDGKLFFDYLSEQGWSILRSHKAGAALVTLASPRLETAEIEYHAIAGERDQGIERQGLRCNFIIKNKEGFQRRLKVHNTWGRFSDTPELHEQYYRSILLPHDHSNYIRIVAGDTNSRIGPVPDDQEGTCNLTTALVPYSFVKEEYGRTLPPNHKVQVADYPDGGFYSVAPDKITQVQQRVIDPSTGQVVPRNRVPLVPNSMAEWNQTQRMVLRLEDSCAEIFHRENDLRERTGDQGAILAPAYNTHGKLTYGIAFTSGNRALRDSLLPAEVEPQQKRSHPVGESDTRLRPHLYAERGVLISAIEEKYRVVSQQRPNETESSKSSSDLQDVPTKRPRLISPHAQKALFITTGILATLAVGDMIFGGISYALDFLPHIITSMPFLAALAGVAGLALLGLGICAIVKVAEYRKRKYGDDSVDLLDDWGNVPSQASFNNPSLPSSSVHSSPISQPQQGTSSSSHTPAPSSSLSSSQVLPAPDPSSSLQRGRGEPQNR